MAPEEGRELPKEARETIEKLVQIVSQPEFTALLREIEDAPEDSQAENAQQLATVSEFRKRGLPIPEGLRVTTRVFENPDDPRILATSIVDESSRGTVPVAEAGNITACISVGVGTGFTLCASVGAEGPVPI